MGFLSSLTAAVSGALADVQGELSKRMNRQLAEAYVAVQVGTANADGEFEPQEKAKFAASLKVNPVLKGQDSSIVMGKAVELQGIFDLDTEMGHDACIKEIKEGISRADEATRITLGRMGVMQAKADGEIEDAERRFLIRVCNEALGLQPSQIGL